MTKLITSSLLILTTLITLTCCEDDPQVPVTVQNGPPGVYVGGQGETANAMLWKDEVSTILTGGGNSRAEYIFVNGNDIYLAGKTTLLNGNFSTLVYWKNGSINTIQDLNSENAFALLKGFTVSGNDLHAVWSENSGRYSIIKYWKNGNVTSITDAAHYAIATSLVVYGNDVYIGGNEDENGLFVAKYWKNGKAFSLSDGKTNAYANSIFIEKGNVYVAGMVSTSQDISKDVQLARYWKNSIPVDLSDGSKNAWANSIFVDESGVYVAGTEMTTNYSVAKYWKNEVAHSLTDGTISSSSSQIFISNNDIYVVGGDGTSGTIWKNGTKLAPFDTNDPALLPLCISVIK
jgi:hypothetical protein